MSNQAAHDSATVIPFPAIRLPSRWLSAQDRADALDWQRSTQVCGWVQVTICERFRDNPQDADFILVYWRGELWSVQGVAGPGRQFRLRRYAPALEISPIGSVHAALETVLVASATPPSSAAGSVWQIAN